MKFSTYRYAIIQAATAGMHKIQGVPEYDALKPYVVEFTSKIVDAMIEQVGADYEGVTSGQLRDIEDAVANMAGTFSGLLTSARLTTEQQHATAKVAMELMLSRLQESQQVVTHSDGIPVLVNPKKQDLN